MSGSNDQGDLLWKEDSHHAPTLSIIFIFVGFTAFLFLITCYIIYRRRCRTPTPPLYPSSPLYTIPECVRQVHLSREDIEAFPTRLFRQVSGSEPTSCPICLSIYPDGIVLRVLPACDHAFHMECIVLCCSSSNLCPICRCNYGYLLPMSPYRSDSPLSLDGLEP